MKIFQVVVLHSCLNNDNVIYTKLLMGHCYACWTTNGSFSLGIRHEHAFCRCYFVNLIVETQFTTMKPTSLTFCRKDDEIVASMQLLSYNNTSMLNVAKGHCDKNGADCDVALDICVSPVQSKYVYE